MVDFEKILGERPRGCSPSRPCGGCCYCTLQAAVDAREESDHYNGYKVGAAILATDAGDVLHIVSAANTYPNETDTHKACAESNVEKKFRTLQKTIPGLGKVVLFLAASDDRQRIMEVNGLEGAETLHPCAGCREFFASDSSTDPNMPVFTSGVSEAGEITALERTSIGEFWGMYSEVRPPEVSAMTTYNFSPQPAV